MFEKIKENYIIIIIIIVIIMAIYYYYYFIDKFNTLNMEVPRTDNEYQYLAQKPNIPIQIEFDVNKKDPNYNTLNNLPYLINPDDANTGYYYNRVKIETNPNSQLIKKETDNLNKINKVINDNKEKPKISNDLGFKGYNNYSDLRNDNYANITSVGKSLLTPFVSFPVPS